MEPVGLRVFSVLIPSLVLLLLCLDSVLGRYSEDQCSWRGSGLSRPQGTVEQVWLRCAEGSVDWLYPSGALRLSLSPRLPRGVLYACIKPSQHFGGAQIYLEKSGVLELLVGDRPPPQGPPQVRCFSATPGEDATLFLQATPHQDISRRIAAFRYELRGDWTARLSMDSQPISVEGACRPCNDSEILMAVCTSDFVFRGNIHAVELDADLRAAVIKVAVTRVFRQKFSLFSGPGGSGEVRTLLECGVRPGPGTFLFTGRAHFGQAWLGCAPRYRDFQKAYSRAKQHLHLPCQLDTD
ncbi:meteorin [Chanos chanos]|uniref:Meteorin n=1 Tax=Chanos chanos TaxID=29144 RepID=A0A6J2V2H5_CHACN|nr:meteorin [Chanos chanos]